MSTTTKNKETITADDLRGIDLFKGLDEKELSQIAPLCTRCTYERDTVIYTPSSTSTDIHLLAEENDAIQIELPLDEHCAKVITHVLRKGEVFGWAALVPPQLRTTRVRCIEKASVITIKGDELSKLIEKNHHMGYVIMKNLSAIISMRLTCTTVALRHEIKKLKDKQGC